MSKTLIKSLGGTQAVAARLGTTCGAVRNWQLEGRSIPWKYRPLIARIAGEKAVPLPENFWEGIAA